MADTRNLKAKASRPGASDPAVSAVAITGADQTLANNSRAVYIATAGSLKCTFEDDSAAVTLVGLVAGTVYPFAIKSITGVGTTATGHVLL